MFGFLMMFVMMGLPIILIVLLIAFGIVAFQYINRSTPGQPMVSILSTSPIARRIDSDRMKRYCVHCGAGLQPDWTHCPQCGAPVSISPTSSG